MHNAVPVDRESYFDLRHTTGRRRNIGQLEAAQGLVVICHLAFALKYVDFHSRLTVCGSGEDLALLARDCGIPVDQAGKDMAFRLQTQ